MSFRGRNVPKITENHKITKMGPRDVPGSKAHPKGIQTASKRHQKDIQKAPKSFQIGSRWNQNYKTPMKKNCKEPSHLNKNRSTCKADLSSHLGCSRLSQCCFLTCKPLACPRSMKVYRYSSQKSIEQPNCKDLQRTLHPIRPHQTRSSIEVRRRRVSVLNKL